MSEAPAKLESTSTVHQMILEVFDSLTPKQRELARYVLDHEEAIAFASASEVAQAVGSSAATVVRFARALGYEGYSDLQESIRAVFPQYRTAAQILADRLSNNGLEADLIHHIAEVNAKNVHESMLQVDMATLNAAADAMINAEELHIFAGGLSSGVAITMEYTLKMLGFPVHAFVNGGTSQALELLQVGEGDCVILISIWRYLRSTIEAAKGARARNATLIALTDSPLATIANLADYAFVAATSRAAHNRSLTGLLAMVDLINAKIVSMRPEQTMQALERFDEIYANQGEL